MSLKACKGHGRSQHVNEDVKGGITIGYIQKVILSYIYIYIYSSIHVCVRVCAGVYRKQNEKRATQQGKTHTSS